MRKSIHCHTLCSVFTAKNFALIFYKISSWSCNNLAISESSCKTATVNCITSVRLSVCPHGTNRPPLGVFHRN